MPRSGGGAAGRSGSVEGRGLTRRDLLGAAGAAAMAGLTRAALPWPAREALAATPRCASISDIDHVVIVIQENRSFDHYFGTYRGVRGYADSAALRLPNGETVFHQPDPANTTKPPVGELLPFHLDTSRPTAADGSGACTED